MCEHSDFCRTSTESWIALSEYFDSGCVEVLTKIVGQNGQMSSWQFCPIKDASRNIALKIGQN